MNTKTAAPKIAMTPVESSQIHSCGFCTDTNTLHVRFRKGDGLGKLYTYPATPDLFHEFMGASSKGAFFGERIRKATNEDGTPKHPHTLVIEEESAEEA